EYLDLVMRERQLLALHEAEWLEPLRDLGSRWEFRHGFVEKGEMTARQFVEQAERLFQLVPLRGMRFTDITELPTNDLGQRVINTSDPEPPWLMPPLAQCPWLSRLRTIAMCGDGYLRTEDVRCLTKSPYISSLQKLDLSQNGLERE